MMSGSKFSQAVQASTLVLVLGSALVPGAAFASSKTKNPMAETTTTTVTNPYFVNVPKTFEYNTTGTIRTQGASASLTGPSQLSFNGVSNAVYVTGSNQTIQLGQFVVNPATTASGAAAVSTYHDTPFVIQVRAPGYDKTSKVALLAEVLPNFGRSFHLKTETINSLLIRGHLDGTVNPSAQSSVTATVDSVKLGGTQPTSKSYGINYTFPVRYSDLKLPTSWTMNTAGNALAATSINPGGPVIGLTTGNAPAATSASAQLLATPAAEMLTVAGTPAGPTPTPEPSTILIFATAAAGFAWSRRRQLSA